MSYLGEIADTIRRNVAPELVPEGADALFLIYAVLATSKGQAVTARDVHDAWTAWMEMSGHNHESMVPFEDLSSDTKSEDSPFLAAIRSAVRTINGAPRLP